jgi:DNA modification methylase
MALLPVIMAFSRSGDIVLGPFIGSGPTAICSSSLGRRYARKAEQRIECESGG